MSYRFTKLLLSLTIFSAPLYIIRFRIGPFPTTLLEVLILLTIFSWVLESGFWMHFSTALEAYKNDKVKISQLRLPTTGYRLPIILFVTAALISTLISPDKHGALGTLKAYVIEPILMYIIVKNVIETQKDLENIITVMVGSGILVNLWVTAQAAFGWFITNPAEAALGRAHGPYNTANAIGLYLGPILALVLPVILESEADPESKFRTGQNDEINQDKIKKLFRLPITDYRLLLYSFIALSLVAILLSKSTGALIATTAVVFCLFLFNRLTRYQVNTFLRLLITGYWLLNILFIFLIVPHLTPKTFWTTTRPEDYTTTTIRLCLWEGTRNMLLERPIFGAGLSGFKELYAEKYATCDSEPLEYPHNLIFNFWAEMGVLGVVSFFWLILTHIRGVTYFPPWRWKSPCTLGITLAFIYVLIHGLVDVPYFKNDLSLQFWLLLALSELQTKRS